MKHKRPGATHQADDNSANGTPDLGHLTSGIDSLTIQDITRFAIDRAGPVASDQAMAAVRATNATESTALIVASIATLEGQINGVKAVMDGVKSTMDDVKTIVKGEKTTMNGMMATVDGVKTAAAKASRAANAAIDRADGTDVDVTLINNTIGEIRDEVNHDYSRLQSLDNEVLEVGNNVKDMESTVEDHEAQIEDLNDQIQTLQAELDALRPVTGVVRTLCVMLRVSYDVLMVAARAQAGDNA